MLNKLPSATKCTKQTKLWLQLWLILYILAHWLTGTCKCDESIINVNSYTCASPAMASQSAVGRFF